MDGFELPVVCANGGEKRGVLDAFPVRVEEGGGGSYGSAGQNVGLVSNELSPDDSG